MNEQLENMTVIMLRKVAKQMGVKLGMGISKQGIIDKLSAALEANPALVDALTIREEEAPAPEAAGNDAPAAPVRRASIIADDEPEDDDDDVPVLTPNPALQNMPRPAGHPAVPPAQQSGASSLSTISSKAPAFTMEGARAWHNPRTYVPQNNYPRSSNSWNLRPGQQPPANDARVYTRPAPPRADPRGAQRPVPSYAQRFGPEQADPDNRVDHRAGYPAPVQNDYQPPVQRGDYRGDWQNQSIGYRGGDYAPQPAPGGYAPHPSQGGGYYHKDVQPGAVPNMADMLMTGDCGDGAGILEVHPEGYGFVRTEGYLPGRSDIYVSNAQVRRFGLRSGDYIEGKTRPQRERDRSVEMLYITEINGHAADENAVRLNFDSLTALYPKRRIELSAKNNDPTLRAIDLFAPIGFGQRALLRTLPGAGKTTLIQKLAGAVSQVSPRTQVMVLLLDERPEEIPLMREAIKGEVIAASFGQPTDSQIKLSEMVLERAMRLVELKKDVVLFVDSLSKLTRAYAAAAPQTARTMPNGLVAGSLNKPRRLFSAARNTKEGGTLTLIAAVDADDPAADEMHNVCNMELTCSKVLADRNVFPALDLNKCQTRRADLILSEAEIALQAQLRQAIREKNALEAVQFIQDLFEKTENNQALAEKLRQAQPDESASEI